VKIAFVEPHLGVYGGIRRILRLANGLVERGHAVTIYHSDGSPCAWMPCRAVTRPIAEAAGATADIVVFNYPPDLPHVERMRRECTVFYVLGLYRKELVRRPDPRVFLMGRYGHERWLSRVFRKPFTFWTNATWMHEWVERSLGRHSELLFGGIDRDLFRPDEETRSEPTVVVTAGDPRPEKGFRFVDEAFRLVSPRLPGVRLETLHGKHDTQPELARALRRATLFVDAQESRAIGWNNPIAEAMASGIPVVATKAAGNRDLLVPGVTGVAVDPHDTPGLGAAIEALLGDESRRARFAAEALTHARSFSWERALARAELLLDHALRGERAAPWRLEPPPNALVAGLPIRDDTLVVCPPDWEAVQDGRPAHPWPADRARDPFDLGRQAPGTSWLLAGPLHEIRNPGSALADLVSRSSEVHLLTPARDYHGPVPAPGRTFPLSRPELLAVATEARARVSWVSPTPQWHVATLTPA
jgi:glycosyltransferase involved in cell wall biosynthesis